MLAAFGLLVAVRSFHWGRPLELLAGGRVGASHVCLRWRTIIGDENGSAPAFAALQLGSETGGGSTGETPIRQSWRHTDVKISARNQLPGTVRTVTRGQVMAEVVVDVEGGHELVAAITAESARRLGLAPGTRVVAVIKSTEVMLAVDE